MDLKAWMQPIIENNVHLITTDRDLQTFMVGAFSLLITIVLYCTYCNDFGQAEVCFHAADLMLSGTFDYPSLGVDLQPLTVLLLLPPRLFSPDPTVYRYLFSLYGFAFYMLGGHFMLKSCRETGYSQRDAYILLFIFFLCAFSWMTLSTGPVAIAFTIMSLWFFHIGRYNTSMVVLALATMTGFFPVLLAIVYIVCLLRRREFIRSVAGWLAYACICTLLLFFPLNNPFAMAEYALSPSLMGLLHVWFGVDVHSWILVIGALLLSICIVVPGAWRISQERPHMRGYALLLELGLIILILLSPEYSPMQFIWIVMLFPMTQMTGHPFKGQKITYLVLTAFCGLSLISDSVIAAGSVSDAVSLIRYVALIILEIQLFREFKSMEN
ncbi:MAG: hypothetical protein MJZ38_04335 [archaeon]|nr:hypothetical protein [archaeon]